MQSKQHVFSYTRLEIFKNRFTLLVCRRYYFVFFFAIYFWQQLLQNLFKRIEMFTNFRNGWSSNFMKILNNFDHTLTKYRISKYLIRWERDPPETLRVGCFREQRFISAYRLNIKRYTSVFRKQWPTPPPTTRHCIFFRLTSSYTWYIAEFSSARRFYRFAQSSKAIHR